MISGVVCLFVVMGVAAGEASAAPGMLKNIPYLSDLNVHGLIRAQFVSNTNSLTGAQTNTLRVFDLKHSGFEVTQGEIIFKSEQDFYPDEKKFGYRFDIVGGRTAQVIAYYPDNAAPNATGQKLTGTATLYDRPRVTLEQAYITYSTKIPAQVDVKVGRFVTWQGVEVIPDIDGVNWLASNTFHFGLGIPFTHTGAQVVYHVDGNLQLGGCAIQGWDTIRDNNSKWSWMGMVMYTLNPNLSWAGTVTHGPEQDTNTSNDRTVYSANLTYKYSDKTTVVGEYLNGREKNPAAPTRGGTAKWRGYTVYVNRIFNEKWNGTLRFEEFKDPDGVRTAAGIPAAGQKELRLRSATGGAGYSFNSNWTWRSEYRHDFADQRNIFTDASAPGGVSNDQGTFQMDLIYKF